MSILKKIVIYQDGREHVCHSDEEVDVKVNEEDNAIVEEREMEYDVDRGWRQVGTKQRTQEDYLIDLDFRLSLVELGLI